MILVWNLVQLKDVVVVVGLPLCEAIKPKLSGNTLKMLLIQKMNAMLSLL